MSKKECRTCISIGPFGGNSQEESYREDIEIALREALAETYDYTPFPQIPKIDMMPDLFSALIDSDLVIADLRGLNPNVMYELGLRHAFNRPVVHLIDEDTPAPWDIDKNYILRYKLPLQISYKDKFIAMVRERVAKIEAIENGSYNSFIGHYKNKAIVEAFKGDSTTQEILGVLFTQVESLKSMVGDLSASSRRGSLFNTYLQLGGHSLSSLAKLNVDTPAARQMGAFEFPTPTSSRSLDEVLKGAESALERSNSTQKKKNQTKGDGSQ